MDKKVIFYHAASGCMQSLVSVALTNSILRETHAS